MPAIGVIVITSMFAELTHSLDVYKNTNCNYSFSAPHILQTIFLHKYDNIVCVKIITPNVKELLGVNSSNIKIAYQHLHDTSSLSFTVSPGTEKIVS